MSVYFVTCRDANAVKIGSSLDPYSRLTEIQWGCPLVLALEAVQDGGFEEEFQFHRRFEDVRIRGEWFTITPMIEAIMEASPALPAPRDDGKPVRRHNEPRHKLNKRERADERTWRFDCEAAERTLNRREAAGDLHFPFRTKEIA